MSVRFEKYSVAWLTINRDCNLRCVWCYAKSTEYLNNLQMSLSDAKFAIDIIASFGIKKIILIGGEPTIHKHFFSIVDYIKSKNIIPLIVTNGVALYDDKFFETLKEKDVPISISIKSSYKDGYIFDTKVDCIDKISSVIKKLLESRMNCGFSYVITESNIDYLADTLKIFSSWGIKHIGLSLCYSSPGNFINYDAIGLIDKFVSVYAELKDMAIKLDLQMTLPMCLWPNDFIEETMKNGIISSICQLQDKSGLIFDTNLDILCCNSIFKYPIVQKDEYDNYNDLVNILSSDRIESIYKNLLKLPSKKCIDCKYLKNCGGGCVLTWQDFSLDKLLERRTNHDNS